ncbi:MAG: nucleotidyltransferase domain-containing protein, partial [Candidatus Pacearchaeota archaeon]|nr:nucleotidyltransferase domain-containing protein [Candidatus Pacearchaeota archaeon]
MSEGEVAEMKYIPKTPEEMEKQIPEEVKREIERIRDRLKEFKRALTKKFSYISAIGILPPPASKLIEEEEEVQKEKEEKLIHVIIVIPEEKAKEINKLKLDGINLLQNIKPKVWLHIKSTKQLWEMCFDGKYALIEAIAMSFPLHDKGILGALRAASIHKALVLKKFERYVVSYVLAGSLVREEASKTSDVDVYIVIDDTDVKRMSRYELREKLRAIIYSYALEAAEIAGVKNKLSPQVYILTEFWEAVKDAHPVIFTFIRDGVPLYDRGAFMPWKLLLKMGKIKPSPEAIDMFMSLGERVAETVKRKLNDIVTEDIYWGVITPSQAALMLYGLPPPTPKEIQQGLFRKVFVEKEKLLEKKYADILEKIVTIYKKYEHEEIKTISGKEIDELLEESKIYLERLKQLMEQIEKRASEQEILQTYNTVFGLLESILGKVKEASMLRRFEEEIIRKAKLSPRSLLLLRKIVEIKKKYSAGKTTRQDLLEMQKAAHELISELIEYTQRRELMEIERSKIGIVYRAKGEGKEVLKKGEIIFLKNAIFIIPDLS